MSVYLRELSIRTNEEAYLIDLSYHSNQKKDLTKPELEKLAKETLRQALAQLEKGSVSKGSSMGFRYEVRKEQLIVQEKA